MPRLGEHRLAGRFLPATGCCRLGFIATMAAIGIHEPCDRFSPKACAARTAGRRTLISLRTGSGQVPPGGTPPLACCVYPPRGTTLLCRQPD